MLFFRSRPLLTGTVAFKKPRKPRATPGCRCVALRGSPPKPSPSLTAPFSSGTAGPFCAGDRSFLSPPPLLYHRKTKKSHRFSKRRAARLGGLLGLILCPVCAPCCPRRRKKPLYAQKSHFSFFNFFCGGLCAGARAPPPSDTDEDVDADEDADVDSPSPKPPPPLLCERAISGARYRARDTATARGRAREIKIAP